MKTYSKPPRSSWPALCRRPLFDLASLEASMAAIFESVRVGQDVRLLAYTEQFDGVEPKTIKLSQRQAAALTRHVPQNLRGAIDRAYQNIQMFHAGEMGSK